MNDAAHDTKLATEHPIPPGVKMVGGVFIAETDTHIVRWMTHSDRARYHEGRLSYQIDKLDLALKIMDKMNRPRRVAVDCGAHVGLWSMHLARLFDRVVAFEPTENALIYPLNVPFPNVMLHRVALGEKEGDVEMQTHLWSSGAGHVVLDPETTPKGDWGKRITVPIRRLDQYRLTTVDLVKIDVEGHEAPLVRGAEGTLRRDKPVVILEQKGWNADHVKDGSKDALALMESWGFVVAASLGGDYVLRHSGKK